jgi:hypothetical protein
MVEAILSPKAHMASLGGPEESERGEQNPVSHKTLEAECQTGAQWQGQVGGKRTKRSALSQRPVADTYNPSYRTVKIGRTTGQSQPRQTVNETLSQKYPTQKRAGKVAQVVEHLPNKREAPSSNPTMAKKKNAQAPTPQEVNCTSAAGMKSIC